ncbi:MULTISPECIES: hypothetical protein [unclassified Fusibacter]|uniref:hypothetical protein n=1 Tax=unclassified Fusibacter TaxID=2624464 RepID=UPI001011BF0A|nr:MULTISPECIES: hypothetical protein [unclassified Fusibacter]MCK8058385.1 hypothetical protein [Fusibacter sp. A2]NPE20968.1 hypothetical protein [Fusibacter sp. A1]RXV63170.1 hypothetical protein DWB64_03960 [Fusibacter sp. A1]
MLELDLFHFGDSGEHDSLSPFFWYEKTMCKRIVAQLIEEPLSLNKQQVEESPEMAPLKQVLAKMVHVGLLKLIDQVYYLDFPFFIEEDKVVLDKLSIHVADELTGYLLKKKEDLLKPLMSIESSKNFPLERLAYHVIGGNLFDDWALDWLHEHEMIALEKTQPNGRAYLLVGYEQSPVMEDLSKGLLLSFNNATGTHMVFSSFGDADGDRKDLYRLLRLYSQGKTENQAFKGLESIFEDWSHEKAHKVIHTSEHLILEAYYDRLHVNDMTEDKIEAFELMKRVGYLKEAETGKIDLAVPLFFEEELEACKESYKPLFESFVPFMKQILKTHEKELENLSAKKHHIDTKDIANELWHQVFGRINENLVKEGVFETPEKRPDEGRYLQAIYVLTK